MTESHSSSAATRPKIGFVGLGTMGGPMCGRLIAAEFPVTAHDLSREALESAVTKGAVGADSAAACAASCDIFLTSLRWPDDVVAVMSDAGALAALPTGSIWVDLTTNRRALVESLAAERPDIAVVDSPVTGAVDGARNGRLTLFAGGDPAARARVVPVLSHLGRVIECGPLGSGNVVKLVTNQLWFVHAAAIGEGFALGMANGVELEVLYDAICDSAGDSFVARHDAPSIFAGHYDPSFPLDLCLKDLGFIADLAAAVDTELVVTNAAHRAFTDAGERYGRDVGELHVAKRLEDDTGLSFRVDGDWTPPWEQ